MSRTKKIKKFITTIMIVSLFATIIPVNLFQTVAFASGGVAYNTEGDATSAGFTFTLSGNEYSITGYSYSLTSAEIPSSINGKNVTSISNNAFHNHSALTTVTIPSTVVSIGQYAFSDCTGVTSVTMADGVTTIGYGGFMGCTHLTSIILPDSVTSIAIGAFYCCSLLNSVTLSKNVATLPSDLFSECHALTTLVIPEGVTTITGYAVNNCENLASITIPYTVTSIGGNAFNNCKSTATFYVGNQAVKGLVNSYLTGYPNRHIIITPTYSVTYDDNGKTNGTVPIDLSTYGHGDTETVLSNTGGLVKTGLTFAGWNTAADGSGITYAPGSSLTVTGATTLYAKWTGTVSYNGNGNTGGSVPTDGTGYVSDQTATVLGNTGSLINTGYIFSGWNTAADRSGTDYVPGSSLTVSGDTTLYANWTNKSIQSVDKIDDIEVPYGTSESDIGLPSTIGVTLNDNTKTSVAITWNHGNPTYDGNTLRTYSFIGTLKMPRGVANSNNKAYVDVIVKKAVNAVDEVHHIPVPYGTSESNLALPSTIDVTLNDNTTTSAAVTWDHGTPPYNGNTPGAYIFTGTLTMPSGEINSGYTASITIIVEGSDDQDVTTPTSVTIKGTERVGKTLDAELLTDTGTAFTTSAGVTYEWYRLSSKNSSDETLIGNDETYKLVTSDKGKYIKVIAAFNGDTFEDITERIANRSSSSSSNSSSNSSDVPVITETQNPNPIIDQGNSLTDGWHQEYDSTFKYSEGGTPITGWKKISDIWYLFHKNTGTMVTGWYNSEIGDWTYLGQDTLGQWFHLYSDGKLTIGWYKDTDNNWYYLCNENQNGALGSMKTGWQYINGAWYYFQSNGAMASNTVVEGYSLGQDGALI